MYLLNDRIDAAEAQRIGLLYRVFGADVFRKEVDALARRLAEGPPLSYRYMKRHLNLARARPPARRARPGGGGDDVHRPQRGLPRPARPLSSPRPRPSSAAGSPGRQDVVMPRVRSRATTGWRSRPEPAHWRAHARAEPRADLEPGAADRGPRADTLPCRLGRVGARAALDPPVDHGLHDRVADRGGAARRARLPDRLPLGLVPRDLAAARDLGGGGRGPEVPHPRRLRFRRDRRRDRGRRRRRARARRQHHQPAGRQEPLPVAGPELDAQGRSRRTSPC